jgi:demethylmenaquinone methyltransferase/2-methoxy-6-polyprenyl-1,4-benzoquinol methylase
MLNQFFPRTLVTAETKGYALPRQVVEQIHRANALSNSNGPELRLQDVYGDELWMKMQSLGLGPSWWSGKTVLDVCCGTGFLSYHMLARAKPAHLTLLDISEKEIAEAEKLIPSKYRDQALKFICTSALDSRCPPASFDVVIGNSFLHHFPDVGFALGEFARIVRPGGLFVSLHEPKAAAIAFESRNPANWLSYVRYGTAFIDGLRSEESVLPATDVWLFDEDELRSLLGDAGFERVRMEQWHFFRPLLVATAALHLNAKRPRLGLLGRGLLRAAVRADALVRGLMPRRYLASLSFSAQKPAA